MVTPLVAQLLGGQDVVIVPFRADEDLSSAHPNVASIPPALFRLLNARRTVKSLGKEGVIRTPRIVILTDPSPGFDDLARLLGTPFVVKGDGSVSGSECFLVKAAGDLKEARHRCGLRLNTAWEYVPGPSLNFHFLCFETGTTVLPPSAQLLTRASDQRPFQFAGSDFTTNCAEDSLAQAHVEVGSVARALQQRGYRGFGGLDVVVCDDGRPFAVDVNPRLQGSTLPLSRGLAASLGIGVGKLQIAACGNTASDLLSALADVPMQAPEWGGQVIVRNEAQGDVQTMAWHRDGVYVRTQNACHWRTHEVPTSLGEGELLVVDCVHPGVRIRSGGLVCRVLFGSQNRDDAMTLSSNIAHELHEMAEDQPITHQ